MNVYMCVYIDINICIKIQYKKIFLSLEIYLFPRIYERFLIIIKFISHIPI